ncbi:uncharacterized protein LOC115627611 [Scaptodrosophila lebanonensis]|uniref:Uncharacterized protein LOC115627611 n=1 Tax=Drosophila lebanonensis TaxID=7225 RepID=A0A6J2TRB7_DROLE|nr:uncharacterized protein LOC115627611 [Scaptodrosophila lebanonensis]
MAFKVCLSCIFASLLSVCVVAQPAARAVDLAYTEITPVTDATRYTALNPNVQLTAFTKVKHVKGNIVFSAGERITGDHLMFNHYDDKTFTKLTDIEVQMTYPASGNTGLTLTAIEIYVDLSADDANAYFIDGGIDQKYAKILLTCDQTRTFVYETFFYGY